ncbi:MAG: hypothetical protein ACYCWE_10535 [Eubacteriales bacterium]
MRKLLILMLALVITMFMAVSCDTAGETETETTAVAESEDAPSSMPARPGSDVTGDPSANLPVEVMGIVKEINDALVLIEIPDNGGDFMLRFSENTKWDAGVNTEIIVGNSIVCLVKLEPTVTTPSQGEVIQVTANDPAN